MVSFVRGEAQGLELHEVERGLFQRVLGLGLTLLRLFLAEKGTGRDGDEIPLDDGTVLPFRQNRKCDYFSVFGKTDIDRAYYWRKGLEGHFPLDGELNLPERSYSYVLQELAVFWASGRPMTR